MGADGEWLWSTSIALHVGPTALVIRCVLFVRPLRTICPATLSRPSSGPLIVLVRAYDYRYLFNVFELNPLEGSVMLETEIVDGHGQVTFSGQEYLSPTAAVDINLPDLHQCLQCISRQTGQHWRRWLAGSCVAQSGSSSRGSEPGVAAFY